MALASLDGPHAERNHLHFVRLRPYLRLHGNK